MRWREFHQRLPDLIDRANRSLLALETGNGLPRGAIRNVLDGHEPKINRADEICRAFGFEIQVCARGSAHGEPSDTSARAPQPPGDGVRDPVHATDAATDPATDLGPDLEGLSEELKASLAQMVHKICSDLDRMIEFADTRLHSDHLADPLQALTQRGPADHEVVPEDQPALVENDSDQSESVEPDNDQGGLVVRMLRDVKAAAGDGADVFEETAFAITIPADALPQGIKARNVAALRAEGASMEPNIRSGDLLVIDHGDLEPREGQLYVLRTDTGLVVKRLKRSGSVWRMTSDNAHWPSRDVSEDDRILGHVVWSGPQGAVTAGG